MEAGGSIDQNVRSPAYYRVQIDIIYSLYYQLYRADDDFFTGGQSVENDPRMPIPPERSQALLVDFSNHFRRNNLGTGHVNTSKKAVGLLLIPLGLCFCCSAKLRSGPGCVCLEGGVYASLHSGTLLSKHSCTPDWTESRKLSEFRAVSDFFSLVRQLL